MCFPFGFGLAPIVVALRSHWLQACSHSRLSEVPLVLRLGFFTYHLFGIPRCDEGNSLQSALGKISDDEM